MAAGRATGGAVSAVCRRSGFAQPPPCAVEAALELLETVVGSDSAAVETSSEQRYAVVIVVYLGLELLDQVVGAHASNSSTE
jgi:hypothetical protein